MDPTEREGKVGARALGSREAPRVLRVDLGRLEPGVGISLPAVSWRGSTASIDRIGREGGIALAVAILHESESARPGSPAPFVIAVGPCVRRAVPTAARACVASRAPLTGRYADGQVGSDLGRRLARVADAIVLGGRAQVPGAVLCVRGEGEARVELRSLPELVGADPERARVLVERALGPCALLRIGRAGTQGIPFASLAAGGDPPSFVGRGGLGARFGALGIVALAIESPAVEPPAVEPGDPSPSENGAVADLARLLLRSPRLRARGAGGTFEVADSFAARGDLRGPAYREALPADRARAWRAGLGDPGAERTGCVGCPTPCGWVFDRGFPLGLAPEPTDRAATRQGARFGALYALGPNLGLADAREALRLLAFCDEVALDAIETGSVLALLGRARDQARLPGRAPWGDVGAWLALVEDLVERRGDGAHLALGARAMAQGCFCALDWDRGSGLGHWDQRLESGKRSRLTCCSTRTANTRTFGWRDLPIVPAGGH
jgi:aldehyde:ferredoxin oxidoreductase